MGDLPPSRVSRLKPFSHTGVDFAGPFKVTMSKHRGIRASKAYLCLFVCFATKAVHLELASDLTMNTFLAALKRFIARRGRCSNLYSDCGTNFVAAHRYLNELFAKAASAESITWHFNPASAPHFGGLWESAIKCAKMHLLRVVGEQILTYEELNTVFTQVEAILNSRPLTPVSNDPHDFSALTPGHFLTLEPLTALPEQDNTALPINRLTRWQLLERMHRDFWNRWSKEYLHNLHQRSKWHLSSTPVKENVLVLIKSDNLPPCKWQLGRIVELHPGADGCTRVASVKTADNNILKRPVIKLCPLPLEDS
ncbi:uncharacterized protein LOC123315434 [Coccinella septempunctata]|uniref:uncharacterized protein LOC123315434 n=1 Tax=Coccinella septempunctata TaxID=41139 RepID=UPI001D063EBA|nr:uncharacterized protein LOC123315434 [Coccinella septempunctata]